MKLYFDLRINKLTQKFGENKLPIYKEWGLKGHNGLDLRYYHSEPIAWPCNLEGKVIRTEIDSSGGIGVDVLVNDNGFYYKLRFWHLKAWDCAVGDKIETGQLFTRADNCFDKETEVLTNKGWKYFADLDKTERVATINMESRELEFQKPFNYVKKFKEKMYHYENGKLDFSLSGEHNVLLERGWHKNKLKLEPIESLKSGKPKLVTRAKWNGCHDATFLLYGKDKKLNKYKTVHLDDINILMDNWLAFLGIMVADGNVRREKNRVTISQSYSYPNKIEYIDGLFALLPFKYKTYDRKQFKKYNALKNWEITDKRLADYLRENVGIEDKKQCPEFIKDLSSKKIQIFLDWFFMGDGFLRERNGSIEKTYYPGTAKKLADQLQELILKSGKSARVCERKFKSVNYELKEYQSEASYLKVPEIEIVDYNDFAYCVSVPNKTLYVRRNGKPIFLGNTGVSTGSHLHFGLKPVEFKQGRWVNKLQNNLYFGAIDPMPFVINTGKNKTIENIKAKIAIIKKVVSLMLQQLKLLKK